MEWVLRSSQLHSTFSNLGYLQGDSYCVDENCNAALESIHRSILNEDKFLRHYRRSIGFGQNVKKDLIPLLIHAKEEKTVGLLTVILVNLTTPIECLFSLESMVKTKHGQHAIFEVNNLLDSTKKAFSDPRATRVIVQFIEKNLEYEKQVKLLPQQCSNINNCLLLLRNLLHIPENSGIDLPNYTGSSHAVQNQILWNIFSQRIDKILMKLMSVPDAYYWGVSLVQCVALLYKDQHILSLQKMLTVWLGTSVSESSEENESNTSPAGSGSQFSLSTSEHASDSSDTGVSGNCKDDSKHTPNDDWNANRHLPTEKNKDSNMANLFVFVGNSINDSKKCDKNTSASCNIRRRKKHRNPIPSDSLKKLGVFRKCKCSYRVRIGKKKSASTSNDDDGNLRPSENRDPILSNCIKKVGTQHRINCSYRIQLETQESASTSSNDDDMPPMKPVHHKPHRPRPKQRPNNRVRTGTSLQEQKRKKIIRRGKSTIINVRGLTHKTPSDEDIAYVLKEFTIDFLLKGYNSMVQMLHNEILTNLKLEIDKAHFYWLLTYFLKCTALLEIEFEHVASVVSYDIVSLLTAEGVVLCEQFELVNKLKPDNLIPCTRRLHLVVTAIREFVQTIDSYKKHIYLKDSDHETLIRLQIKMCETEELRSLLVLLLRNYDPKYHSKQYLQDIVITNHILLMFLDNIMKYPGFKCSTSMGDHLKQFASADIMYKYGLLLKDIHSNGKFLNDCIFTVMYHVGGEVDGVNTLYQPNILEIFATTWESDLKLSPEWLELIKYVTTSFVMKRTQARRTAFLQEEFGSSEDEHSLYNVPSQTKELNEMGLKEKDIKQDARKCNASNERWTEDEICSLRWMYMQCNTSSDVIGEVIDKLKDDDIIKSRNAVVSELLNQRVITNKEFGMFMDDERNRKLKVVGAAESAEDELDVEGKEIQNLDIANLSEQLVQDGLSKALDWVQKVLLDACYAKIYVEKRKMDAAAMEDSKLMEFELFKKSAFHILSVMSPVSYHSIILNEPVPLVIWNCEQARICKNRKFLQLLLKLGFSMPVDSGKVFIRIPESWTADLMYEVAAKLGPIDTSKLKFSVNEFAQTSAAPPGQQGCKMSTGEEHQEQLTPVAKFTPKLLKREKSPIGAKETSDMDTNDSPCHSQSSSVESNTELDSDSVSVLDSDSDSDSESDSDSDSDAESDSATASDAGGGDCVRSRSPLRRAARSRSRARARSRPRSRPRAFLLESLKLTARPLVPGRRSALLLRRASE